MEDFFISYNKADRHWASGIGDWLDQAGFTTIIQERDFAAGSNFVSEMHRALQKAKRLLMILSPDFLSAKFPEAEWTAALASDPTGAKRTVIPVRVRDCEPPGLLRTIIYIDLVGLRPDEARKKLIAEIKKSVSVGRGNRKRINTDLSNAANSLEDPQAGRVNQTISGKGNFVAGRDFIMYQEPPKEKIVIERRPDAISAEQEWQIGVWIEKLAELTTNKTRDDAFAMWGARFKNKFRVRHRGELPAARFPDAEAWYRQHSGILTRRLRAKEPQTYRKARYRSIHQAITTMGVDKLEYYRKAAARLNIEPFTSLTELTKVNLERLYTMARRDARQ